MLRLLAMVAAAVAVVWIANDPPAALRSLGDAERLVVEGMRDGSATLDRGAAAIERATRHVDPEPRSVAPRELLTPELPPPVPAAEPAPAVPERPAAAYSTLRGVGSESRYADPLSTAEAAAVRGRLDQVMARASAASRGRP